MKVNYARLQTEQRNPRSTRIDQMSSLQIAQLMVREERYVERALAKAAPRLARVVDQIVHSFRQGGRLVFIGAGTSGRLGILEAAECPPTFNSKPGQVQGLMAGGKTAVFRSQEGAEDNEPKAIAVVRKTVRRGDVVVGVAASGVTPYVRAGLNQAHRQGAVTVLVTCAKVQPLPFLFQWVHLPVGPEVVTGSTRLKSGTVCKLALNILTTASFVRFGKVYENRMVDLQPRSRKLVARGRLLIEQLSGVDAATAARLMTRSGGEVKTAIVMARKKCTVSQARQILRVNHESLRKALKR